MSDAGSATVAVVGALVACGALGAAVAAGAGVARAEAHAQGAADAAALSGAVVARTGGDACRTALDVVRANAADPVACAADGAVITVRVAVATPLPAAAVADAVAGPLW